MDARSDEKFSFRAGLRARYFSKGIQRQRENAKRQRVHHPARKAHRYVDALCALDDALADASRSRVAVAASSIITRDFRGGFGKRDFFPVSGFFIPNARLNAPRAQQIGGRATRFGSANGDQTFQRSRDAA